MAKVMFDVLLPSTGRHYDFWVPEAMQVAEPDYYEAAPDAALMYVPTGEIQEPSATAAEIGFTDGDAFVLV